MDVDAIYRNLGSRIRGLRKDIRLTQAQLALGHREVRHHCLTCLFEVVHGDAHVDVMGHVHEDRVEEQVVDHRVHAQDGRAVELARELLGYLPSNNTEDPPHRPPADLALEPDDGMDGLIPGDSSEAMDTRAVIDRLAPGLLGGHVLDGAE